MKKIITTCLVGASIFTYGTSSFADNSNTLHDTNGNVLKTDTAYCIRPMQLDPKVSITVDDSGYVKADDNDINCQYAYKLVGDDYVNNRNVIAGETIRFKEMKKSSDGSYRKTNRFLQVNPIKYIFSAEIDSQRVPEWTRLPDSYKPYDFAKFRLEATNNNGSEMQIKFSTFDENYVWRTPFTILWEERWVKLQDPSKLNGITSFELKPVE